MEIDMTELVEVFLAESDEQISTLEEDILKLEKSGADTALIQELFRVAHTLKGGAASLGFDKLAEVTHALESVLGNVRDGKREVDADLVDALLASLDVIKCLRERAGGNDEDVDISEALQLLGAAAAEGERQEADACPDASKPTDDTQVQERLAAGEAVMEVSVTLSEACVMKGVRATLVIAELEELGKVLRTIPGQGEIAEENFERSFRVLLATDRQPEAIAEKVRGQAEVAEVQVTPASEQDGDVQGSGEEVQLLGEILVSEGKVSPSDVEDALKRQAPIGQILVEQKKIKPQDVEQALTKQEQQRLAGARGIRVDMKVLDSLMNLIGESAVVSARISRVTKTLHARRLPEIAEDVGELANAADLSERISDELQTILLDMRLLPIRTIFQKFPRVVRDVARTGRKEVELVTRGGETLVDKAVLDRLGDPLLHAIRNAADHGIEPPEERKAQGKAAAGRVVLQARREGESIVIEVIDDGRGMDAQQIRRKAVEKGIITAEDAEAFSDEEALRLILRPGFSTMEEVTDISGRGVGMDVVAATMKELNGRVDILSEAGKGSTLRLTIPVKKLMMDLLLVSTCGQRYGVPLEAVAETTRVSKTAIRTIDKQEAVFLRGSLLPLVRLQDVMELGETTEASREELPVVVLALGEKRLGVIVDRIDDHQEVMLKELRWEFGELLGVMGAAILGNGEVVMVLAPDGIAELAREAARRHGTGNTGWGASGYVTCLQASGQQSRQVAGAQMVW